MQRAKRMFTVRVSDVPHSYACSLCPYVALFQSKLVVFFGKCLLEAAQQLQQLKNEKRMGHVIDA